MSSDSDKGLHTASSNERPLNGVPSLEQPREPVFSDQKDDHVPGAIANSTTRSIGVRKAEILAQQYDSWLLRGIYLFCVFCVAYCYSLDIGIRSVFQSYATSSYSNHSLLATVNVIKAVVAAAAQPTYARLSDRFGRLELTIVSIIFYAIGTVIQSQAFDVQRFAGGLVLYQIGYSGVSILLQVSLADMSLLNYRLVASFVPALPFIINTWVSGDISSDLLSKHKWSYNIGIWAFIFPLSCVPMLICMVHMLVKARKTEEWQLLRAEEKQKKLWHSLRQNIFVDLFWELDVVGILFIICVFGFILVPFTIAGGVQTTWQKASTIAPLVIGFVLIPFFILWEARYARFPVIPFSLLRDRGVWSALVIGILIDFIWYMPNDFMYTVLIVGMRASIKAATRITSLYSFVSVIVGPLLGLLVIKFRRLKGFIIFGTAMWIISLGILLHFRGDNDGIESQKYLNGVIGGLCLMGFGAGFFTYPVQVSISTCTNHEYMAVVISLYLSSYNVGTALGSSVSGAVWSQTMPQKLIKKFAAAGLDTTLADSAYAAPFEFIVKYTWGTPERIAVVLAYAEVQRLLCIVGIVLCAPLMFVSLFLRDHKLQSVQSLELAQDHEKGVHGKDGDLRGAVLVNDYDDDAIFTTIKGWFGRK